MKVNKRKAILFLVLLLSIVLISGCQRSSERVAYNLDYQAEEFKLSRRIIAINGFTDKPIFEIVGYCSIETGGSYVDGAMEITCNVAHNEYTKNFIYLSDNVLITVEQIKAIHVPRYHYQINFAPQSILSIPIITGGRIGE